MTINEQAELKKILIALNGLINQLLPEDDLARLALDPKRQASAARVVGTTALARDLIDRALHLCNQMPHPNGLPKKKDQRDFGRTTVSAATYALKRLDRATAPLRRSDLNRDAIADGVCVGTTMYAALDKLVKQGKITLDKESSTVTLVR